MKSNCNVHKHDKVDNKDKNILHTKIGSDVPQLQSLEESSQIPIAEDIEDDIIRLDKDNNSFIANLLDGSKIMVLVDSGSTNSILSQNLIENHSCIKARGQWSKLQEPAKLGIANGGHIIADYQIKFDIYVQGKPIVINALVVRQSLGTPDILLGTNDLQMMDGILNFKRNVLLIKRKIRPCFKLDKDVTIPKYGVKYVKMYAKIKKPFKSKDVVIQATGLGKRTLPNRSLIRLKNNKCHVPLTNTTGKEIKLRKGMIMANLDCKTSFYIMHPVYRLDILNDKTLMYIEDVREDRDRQDLYPATDDSKVYETKDRKQIKEYNSQKYPFLDSQDIKINMTPREILEMEIDLHKECILPQKDKKPFMNTLENYKEAFSLYGEIGDCDYTVDLKVNNDDMRFIRPYYASETDRILIDAEMKRLEMMGVIKEGLASFSSPVMLVAKKDATAKKRVVLDLRKLNSLIDKLNFPFPLVEDCLERIGSYQAKILSAIDIRDAFFSIRLSPESQKYCGVSTYTGGKSYYFVRLCQGLSISPSVFSEYIGKVLSSVPDHEKFCLSYMDDLLIFSETVEDHQRHIAVILEAIQKHGLKISPKKSLFFRKKVEYLGYIIEIINGYPHIGIQNSKIDAIRRLKPPNTLKTVRGFCGMVNFLSKFLPKLSEILRPIRRLTRKNVPFQWSESCQNSFEEIKKLISQAPVLRLPNRHGLIRVYIDTSKTGVGCSIFQTPDIEGLEPEGLIGYYSKTLPAACERYSSTELEAFGIYNVVSAIRMLKSRYFHIITDHSALLNIFQSHNEIPTLRLKKIMEKLSRYQFSLFHKSGKEMFICDFLSRASFEPDDATPTVPPMAIENLLYVTTRRKAKETGQVIPEIKDSIRELEKVTKIKKVHKPEVIESSLDPVQDTVPPTDTDIITNEPTRDNEDNPMENMDFTDKRDQPENIITSIPVVEKPKEPLGTTITKNILVGPDLANTRNNEDLEKHRINTSDTTDVNDPELSPYIRDNTLVGRGTSVSLDQIPISRKSFIPLLSKDKKELETMYDTHTPVTGSDFIVPEPLFRSLQEQDIVWKRIPKQVELEKFLQEVRSRCLGDFSVPIKHKEITQELRSDPFFKHIYNYLHSGILPTSKRQSRIIKNNAEDYVLVKELLFKIVEPKNDSDYRLLLAIPDSCSHYIINHYHDSLVSSHQGIIKCFYKIKQKYFIPKLFDKLTQYIQSCAICQARKVPTKSQETFEWLPRISQGYKVFDELHVDTKHMYESVEGFKYMLVLIDAASRFTLAFPMKRVTAASVAEIILQKICLFFGPFKTLYSDLGKEFNNKIMLYLTRALGIELKFCAEQFHQSNLSERAIKTISEHLLSRLTGHGRQWPMYLPAVCYAINTAPHRTLQGFTPYQLLFGREPRDFLNLHLETGLESIPISYRDYAHNIKDKLQKVGQIVTELQNKCQEEQRLNRAQSIKLAEPFKEGDLVYLLYPRNTDLQTNTLKFKVSWLGPLMVDAMIDDRNCTLSDLEGRLLNGIFSIKRLKRAYFRGELGNISNIKNLKRDVHGAVGNTPSTMLCFNDGYVPSHVDLNDHLSSFDDCPFVDNKTLHLIPRDNVMLVTCPTERCGSNRKKIRIGQNRGEGRPAEHSEMIVKRARYKDGILQILLSSNEISYDVWITPCADLHKDVHNLCVIHVLNKDSLPTGRVIIVSKQVAQKPISELKKESVRVTGSILNFDRFRFGKPSVPAYSSNELDRKVCFIEEVDG